MDVTTQLELCLHEQTQIVTNAAYRVGSQQFLSYLAPFYCDPYFFLNLLFITSSDDIQPSTVVSDQ